MNGVQVWQNKTSITRNARQRQVGGRMNPWTWISSGSGLGGNEQSPPSLKIKCETEGRWGQNGPSNSLFEWGRVWWAWTKPSVMRNVGQRVGVRRTVLRLTFWVREGVLGHRMQQGGVMGVNEPSVAWSTSQRTGVGRRGLWDVFQVREGGDGLHHLKHNLEGRCQRSGAQKSNQ